jgi:hypothetical protein
MKLLHYLLITTLIIHTIHINAMDDTSLNVFDRLWDEAEKQSFAIPAPPSAGMPPGQTNRRTVHYAQNSDRRGPLDDSDSESDPIPFPSHTKCHIDAIIDQIKKGTLRKFTYDMENMRDLDRRTIMHDGNIIDISSSAYTIAYLQYHRHSDANFLYPLKMTGGTPDIIRGIQERRQYQFPNNIILTDDTLPNTTPLVCGSCCTEQRVREEKNMVIEGEIYQLPKDIQDTIKREIPSPAYFIQTAVNQYLDIVQQWQNETPEARKKRLYKRAIRLLFAPEPKD